MTAVTPRPYPPVPADVSEQAQRLFADVSGFPPTLLQSGTRDLFLSSTVRMHRKLRDGGVEAELHVWEAMPHGGFADAPEDVEVQIEVRKFLERHRRGK